MTKYLSHVILFVALTGGAVMGVVAGGLSCSSNGDQGASSAGGSSGSGGSGILDASGDGQWAGPFGDFPAKPVIGTGLPSNMPELFGAKPGSDTGGPCLSEPALEALVPSNWTPLVFEWKAPAGQNVFELILSVDNQVNDLVLYTTETSYVVDAQIWSLLTQHSSGRDIQVTLRGATTDGTSLTADPATGASGVVHLAPVPAKGAVVYWDASGATSFEGFRPGDQQPVTVLTPASAGSAPSGTPTTCISCHASAANGKLLVYTSDSADGRRVLDVRMMDGTGVPSATMTTPSALALLGRHKQTAPTTTTADDPALQSRVVSVLIEPTLTKGRSELIWTNLLSPDANGWGIVARTGDAREATSPSWSHDGTRIAYVSSETAGEGVIAGGAMDIYTVPFQSGAGGNAQPLAGASDPKLREFYPVYSPNDSIIAFNRTDLPVNSYNQPSAELFVVPGSGGTARRLRANDPMACTGMASPGLTNSWPRWAPQAVEHGGKRYYWLVFSSKRHAASADAKGELMAQLYVAGVVTEVTATGEQVVQDYPALYVAAQKPTNRNHTPVWDYFEVPEAPK